MTISRLAVAAAFVAAVSAPVLAQEQVAPPSPANQAADMREKPVTGALNAEVKDNLDTQEAIGAELQAQYDLDRAAYREAAKARVAVIGRDTARQMRREDAYARAMIAWRAQVAACRSGKTRACEQPSPTPADYYDY